MHKIVFPAVVLATGAIAGFGLVGEAFRASDIAAVHEDLDALQGCQTGQNIMQRTNIGELLCAGVLLEQVPGEVTINSRIMIDWDATEARVQKDLDIAEGVRSRIINDGLGLLIGLIAGGSVLLVTDIVRQKRAKKHRNEITISELPA
jgi:hypothetical protein